MDPDFNSKHSAKLNLGAHSSRPTEAYDNRHGFSRHCRNGKEHTDRRRVRDRSQQALLTWVKALCEVAAEWLGAELPAQCLYHHTPVRNICEIPSDCHPRSLPARLYATNFHAATVDVFHTSFNPVSTSGGFVDTALPSGYAPFNIVLFGGKLFVTYAVQDAAKHDDVAGMSHGIIDVFDLQGHFLQRFAQHGQLNSPWGMTMAPAGFGELGGTLWVGNFGNGQINAYDPQTGRFINKVRDPHGQALVIDGLWSLQVGNGANGGDANSIYFTAGPNDEQDGIFGSLSPH